MINKQYSTVFGYRTAMRALTILDLFDRGAASKAKKKKKKKKRKKKKENIF